MQANRALSRTKFSSLARWSFAAIALGAWVGLPGLPLPASAVTITRTSDSVFYTDIPKGLSCGYASYVISNDTASTTYSNIWVKVDTFSGTVVKPGGGDPGIYSLDNLAPGQIKMAFTYLLATSTTSVAQSHTVRVYEGYPGTGGTALTNVTFSLTVKSTLENNSSKVNSVTYSPNPPILGGLVQINVLGDCGNVQNNDAIDFTPAAFTNWNAAAFEMVGVSLTLTNNH
ncbi:MAG: hypothetical protein WCI17_09370 [bacterium]